jgi:hypothetical protein
MNVEPLQFRDVIDRHSSYQPVYRVDFWRQQDPAPGGDPEIMGYKQDSVRIRGAKSVREVRAWAEENAAGRQLVIWIELGPDDDRTIVRVEGVDPTRPKHRHQAE